MIVVNHSFVYTLQLRFSADNDYENKMMLCSHRSGQKLSSRSEVYSWSAYWKICFEGMRLLISSFMWLSVGVLQLVGLMGDSLEWVCPDSTGLQLLGENRSRFVNRRCLY